MITTDFLSLNVDKLFEEHVVQDIDQIQRKIQSEVETKREELRLNVGERYRDLLKAADTITKMRKTSCDVVEGVEKISVKCKQFNERQLIGFKVDSPETQHLDRLSNKSLNNYFGTVVQIKLLTQLPEMIWSHLDKEEFFIATQLFIFARHISTGLQLDTNNNVMKHFPVARKQWEMMKQFFFTIKQRALEVLEREDLSVRLSTDCLLTLFLLEKSTLGDIFQSFLNLRLNSAKKSLESEGRVKEKILTSLRILNSTVVLIWKCFFEGEEGMIIKSLEDLKSFEKGTLSYLNIKESQLIDVLPEIIVKFRPTFDKPSLNPDILRKCMNDWFQTINMVFGSLLKNNFELISSMKTIEELKKEALGMENPKEWALLCNELSIQHSTEPFFESKYQPLIHNRIRAIVKNSWQQCIKSIYDIIVKEIDVQEMPSLWTEDMADIPTSLKSIKNNHLLMKTKGYSDGILNVSKSFDSNLKEILEEIEVLVKESFSIKEDKIALIEFTKETSANEICNLISELKCLGNANNCPIKMTHLFLARVLMAFVELCPHLKESLSWSIVEDVDSWQTILEDKKKFEKWNQIAGLLVDESFYYWKCFCDSLITDISEEAYILKQFGFSGVLNEFLNWECLTVEETTTIRIPSQPRISLQQYLLKISKLLNEYTPQTLPIKVLHYFNEKLIENLIDIYENIGNEKFIEGNQNTALQIYFDLKFIQTIFTKRDDKCTLERIQKISDTLKQFIDPFDFELFQTHLNANIKKCVARMRAQFGILLPYPEKVDLLFSGCDVKLLSVGGEPNVISLSSSGSTSTWFPLLPIIVQEEKMAEESKQDVREQSIHQPSGSKPKKPVTIAQKAAKSSFFGMSQEWFK